MPAKYNTMMHSDNSQIWQFCYEKRRKVTLRGKGLKGRAMNSIMNSPQAGRASGRELGLGFELAAE